MTINEALEIVTDQIAKAGLDIRKINRDEILRAAQELAARQNDNPFLDNVVRLR